MSLSIAIELIRGELPETVAASVQRALVSCVYAKELTVPSFSVWHVKDPESIRSICKRRLVACETVSKGKWLTEQIDFLDRSIAANLTNYLWQAYCVNDVGRISFIIDTRRGEYRTGPFP